MMDSKMNIRINPHAAALMVQAELSASFTGLTLRWFRDAFVKKKKPSLIA